MYIGLDLELNSSEIDYQAIEVPGRDGDLVVLNNRRKSFIQEIPVIYVGEYSERYQHLDDFRQAMLSDGLFHDLSFNNEPGFIYRAAFLSAFKVNRNYNEFTQTLSFNMMPFKYIKSGQSYQTITTGVKLNNTGTIPAKPVIKITGSGDCTAQIGSKSVSLKGIDGGIIMDTDSQLCTNLASTRTQFDKMYGDFMTIPTGNQTVTITGKNITKVEVKPRWAVRA